LEQGRQLAMASPDEILCSGGVPPVDQVFRWYHLVQGVHFHAMHASFNLSVMPSSAEL